MLFKLFVFQLCTDKVCVYLISTQFQVRSVIISKSLLNISFEIDTVYIESDWPSH